MNKSKILYDSEPESEEEPQIKNEVVPSNQIITPSEQPEIPKLKTSNRQSKKITEQPKPEEWTNFVDDNLEKYKAKTRGLQPKNFKCKYCNAEFVREYNLTRHIDDLRCTVKRDEDIKRQQEIKEIEKQLIIKLQKKELRKERKILKDKLKDLPPEKTRKPRTTKTKIIKDDSTPIPPTPTAPPSPPVQQIQQLIKPKPQIQQQQQTKYIFRFI